MKPTSTATTRSITRRPRAAEPSYRLLQDGQRLVSPETRLEYRVGEFLGEGGFGQVYLARRRGHSKDVADIACVKVSERMDGWLREAYFGQVLQGHPRAIRVYEAFPQMTAAGGILYCLVLEYAKHGDLRAFLRRLPRGWRENKVRAEIAGILEVLGKLHRGQQLHRDLTPLNVFVCDGPCLKLGDFGLTRPQSDQRGITARTMNAMTAPSDILAGAVPKWQARDDVYQVGQLLGMLVRGDADSRLGTKDVRGLACSDHLKEIIHRCLGERRKRYESANELIDALRQPAISLRAGQVRSLRGVHLAFTGILSRPRIQAARAARRAGAVVHGGPSALTTVVVRGRPNAQQVAGRDAGLKLMEIKRLRAKGHRITLLGEARFWELAGSRRK
jgi:serine/threonine protein kinase